ncbi:MAG: DNA cytosine methyltransferase, partial [Nostocales cyanobacterium W4_Combined_metabat2_030]|nr:DNA cytosine methyltransferase [Nostocales cyanobacterium W4_Combined_metabat2_030]
PTLSLFDQGDTRATTVAVAHAFYSTGETHGVNQHPEVSPTVKVGSGLGIPSPPAVAQAMTVRRLTPRECERLQGFPDDWKFAGGKTSVYRQIGNISFDNSNFFFRFLLILYFN